MKGRANMGAHACVCTPPPNKQSNSPRMTGVINISLASVTINANTFDSFFKKTKPVRFEK